MLQNAIERLEVELTREINRDDAENVRGWAGDVRASFDHLEAIVNAQRQQVHERLFRKVGDENNSEQGDIESLKKADEQIVKLLDLVKSQLIVLSMQASSEVEARVENQDDENDEHVQDTIDRGTELIHWIRDQQATVTAWFEETFVRIT